MAESCSANTARRATGRPCAAAPLCLRGLMPRRSPISRPPSLRAPYAPARGPMPAFPAPVVTDKQLDSIVEYVKFVQHPPSPGGSPLNWYGPVAEGFVAWVVVFGLIGIVGWIEKGGKG